VLDVVKPTSVIYVEKVSRRIRDEVMSMNSMLKQAVTWFFSKTPRVQHLRINELKWS
jgi:hypothetical protein